MGGADSIVLDPPAFAKNKASVPNALAGYKEINLRAMRLLRAGGYLITSSCSYNVNENAFGATLHEASVDSRVPVALVEKRMQGRDHPALHLAERVVRLAHCPVLVLRK